MDTIHLTKQPHDCSKGKPPGHIKPNIANDCVMHEDGEVVGFFLRQLPKKACALVDIANNELRSDRVPKSMMERKERIGTRADGKGIYNVIKQYSAIIGSIPPKPHMRRPYASRSSVHASPTSKNFVKAMTGLMRQCNAIYRDIMPQAYEQHRAAMQAVPAKWRFGELFTSSISNCNISAPYHIDHANLRPTCNFIITKRHRSTGGNLHVPDYDACFDQGSYSLLVYPAWRNMHGVTPIVPQQEGGYRNSLIFYSLKALRNA